MAVAEIKRGVKRHERDDVDVDDSTDTDATPDSVKDVVKRSLSKILLKNNQRTEHWDVQVDEKCIHFRHLSETLTYGQVEALLQLCLPYITVYRVVWYMPTTGSGGHAQSGRLTWILVPQINTHYEDPSTFNDVSLGAMERMSTRHFEGTIASAESLGLDSRDWCELQHLYALVCKMQGCKTPPNVCISVKRYDQERSVLICEGFREIDITELRLISGKFSTSLIDAKPNVHKGDVQIFLALQNAPIDTRSYVWTRVGLHRTKLEHVLIPASGSGPGAGQTDSVAVDGTIDKYSQVKRRKFTGVSTVAIPIVPASPAVDDDNDVRMA